MSKKLDNSRPEGRLRLKTSTRSEATSSKQSDPRVETSEFSNTSTDDSLVDFKSPKQTSKLLPKVSVQTIRPKKTSSTRKDHSRPKPTESRRNQQLIPTLFAKTEAESSTFVCPLCLKPFSASDIQLIHTKNCALKNNVSTEKLLAAVELQERQSKERKAIGLPAKPLPNAKRRPSTSRRAAPGDDPDIQLALALSMSLNEVEQQEEMDEAIALAAGEDEKILEMSFSQRRSTLVSFGFSTNKPVNQVVERPRRNRKLLGPTVLQNRTQEIREQILTEKIAEVLVGSESVTQQQQQQQQHQETSRIVRAERMGVKRHGELRRWWNESASLWSLSVGVDDEGYYVEELRDFMGVSRRGIEAKCFDKIHRTGEDRGVSDDLEGEKIGGIENCEMIGDGGLMGKKTSEDHDLIQDICRGDGEMIEEGENESLEGVKTVEDRRRMEKNKRTISDLQRDIEDHNFIKKSQSENLHLQKNIKDCKMMPKIIEDDTMNADYRGEDLDAKTSEDHGTMEDCKSKNLKIAMIIIDEEENNSVAQRMTEDHRVIVRSENSNSDLENSFEEHKMIPDIDNETSASNGQKSADVDRHLDISISRITHNYSREGTSAVDNAERNIEKCFDIGNSDKNFITSLSNDWSKMVASSYLSDIAIFVRDTSFIHAHSLVFWTRCHPLTRDYETCNFEDRNDRKCYPIKNKIHWSDIDHDAAMIFLKYIYSGQISPEDLRRKNIFQQIIFLASKYGITELLKFVESLREEVNGRFGIGRITPDVFEQKSSVDATGDDDDHLGEEKNQKNLSGRMLKALENFPNSSSAGVVEQKSSFEGSNDANGNLNRSQKNEGVADNNNDDNDFNTKKISRTLRKSQTTEAAPTVSKNTEKFSRSFTQQKSSSNESDLDDNITEKINRTSENSSTTPVIDIDSSLDGSIDQDHPKVEQIIVKTRETVEKSFNRRLNTTSPDLFDDSEMFDDFPANSPKLASLNISNVSKPSPPSNKNLETKQKSDLSVFIDKIQRQQARGVLESDTDGETPVKMMENCKRNPFRVRCRQFDDSEPCGKSKSEIEGSSGDRMGPLSILENEIRARPGIRDDLVRIHDQVCEEKREGDGSGEDGDDECMETTEIPDNEELEESRYSRYRKLERDNSIENYRKALMGVKSPFDDSRRNAGYSPERNSRSAHSETEDEEIPRDECSQMRRRNHGEPLKNNCERLSISGDLAFDTWEEHSRSSDCILTEGISPVDASKPIYIGADTNCLEEVSDGREKLSFASSHNLSDDDAEDLVREKNAREADGEGRPIPSPIVLSSDDEVAKVMERSSQENYSQQSNPRCTSQRSSPDHSDPPPDENLNYFPDRQFSTPSHRQIPQKIPLRDNSESLNRLPSPSGNPLKRTRTPSSLQISHTVTPPLDYLRMASPDLCEELNKYGLKPQKRSRAIQLLEHIYDELHPLVPLESLPQETPLTDSENEEPVVKKRHLNAMSMSKSPKGKIIPEEMEFQEVEGTDQPAGVLSVKEAFQRLLRNDRGLHGQVLAYEPLPLESLREKLKAEGFGGKINDVMDFLDDECITFQVQMQKKNRRIRNAKNMKSGRK